MKWHEYLIVIALTIITVGTIYVDIEKGKENKLRDQVISEYYQSTEALLDSLHIQEGDVFDNYIISKHKLNLIYHYDDLTTKP